MGIATALLLSGCIDPGPPQPNMSLEIGDEGVVSNAGRMCNTVGLYETLRKRFMDATQEEMDAFNIALEDGGCTSAYEKDLHYKVLDIGPVVEHRSGCNRYYMVTIELEGHGTRYVHNRRITGETAEQLEYIINCN
ncbi:hypothetical protein HVA01_27260 [Halovibrio variabilis]|uniref:Uncharacterized protein n=2 Tax=Halovibrio variabilis TaxID=31910 RepID=A0A511UR77_9GAMM|nr:hypothetical protein HVA01_27260 [Halovibrio variabilis]